MFRYFNLIAMANLLPKIIYFREGKLTQNLTTQNAAVIY